MKMMSLGYHQCVSADVSLRTTVCQALGRDLRGVREGRTQACEGAALSTGSDGARSDKLAACRRLRLKGKFRRWRGHLLGGKNQGWLQWRRWDLIWTLKTGCRLELEGKTFRVEGSVCTRLKTGLFGLLGRWTCQFGSGPGITVKRAVLPLSWVNSSNLCRNILKLKQTLVTLWLCELGRK